MRLNGKTALITGGCSGIGLAGVDLFAKEGARVLAADIQDDKGRALEARFPGLVRYLRCDVTSEADVAAAVAQAHAHGGGRLDVIWNNAGAVTTLDGVETIEIAAFEHEMRLLVSSVVAGIKHAVPLMRAQGGGAIINTASMGALQIGHAPFAYCTAKAAVKWMTSALAVELAPANIRVNCLCPGYIATSAFGRGMGLPVDQADQMAARLAEGFALLQPLQRAGAPLDVAEAALWLASDASAFVTGHALVVDGGICLAAAHTFDPAIQAPVLRALGGAV
jgi:NAD(P)-dependent dehydrogenase (short-subunit alcohol dehydrogenase family)